MRLTLWRAKGKMAVEGFTGSLAHELAMFKVRVKLVEPGYAPTTRFTSSGPFPVDHFPAGVLDRDDSLSSPRPGRMR